MDEKIFEMAEVIEKNGDEVAVIEETVMVNEDGQGGHEVALSAELVKDPEHRLEGFRAARDILLLGVLEKGAEKLGVQLLPSAEDPFDRLHGVYEHHEIGAPLDLAIVLDEFLREAPHTHHFAIELVLAIRVNTRWRTAPKDEMTAREILKLADLSADEYSLYFPPESVDPLPPDTPLKLHRGQRFEAQRDGKYGEV